MVQITAKGRIRWSPSRKRMIRNSSFMGLGLGIFLFVVSATMNIHIQKSQNRYDNATKTLLGQRRLASDGQSNAVFMKDLHTVKADDLWKDLLLEAEHMTREIVNTTSSLSVPLLHVMEVGMHSANQCLAAAARNLHAHCVEPSPSSFRRINRKVKKQAYGINKNVRFYQMAASDKTGLDLEFTSEGGTGDHVGGGGVNMWTMTKDAPVASVGDKDDAVNKNASTVMVKSVALDDVIYNKVHPSIDYALMENNNQGDAVKSRSAVDDIDKLFLLKVDTQGHEPSVFSGLKKSIQDHKIDFIMTEYWPKGMDFMNDSMGRDTECQKSVGILKFMYDAGYTLYTMQITNHPKAPLNEARWAVTRHNNHYKSELPIDDFMAHCMWFYDLERDPKYKSDSSTEYKMGFWADVLAVSPGARLAKVPISENGKIIAKHLSFSSMGATSNI